MHESTAERWVRRLFLLVMAVVVLTPLAVLVRTSLVPLTAVTDGWSWWPERLTLRPWIDMWSSVPLAGYFMNSLVVATLTTTLAVLVAVPAAYAVARGPLPGRRPLLLVLLVAQAVPGLVVLVPLFLLYSEAERRLGVDLIGARTGLVLTDVALVLPLAIWLVSAQLAATPTDLEDAARLDGASTRAVLTHVVVPSLAPTIAVTATLAFLLAWSEVLFASVLAQGGAQTLPVGLHAFATSSGVRWNELCAAGLLSAIPIVVASLPLARWARRR